MREDSHKTAFDRVMLLFIFGQVVGDERIGVTMAELILALEPVDHFKVLFALLSFEQVEPIADRLAILLFNRRKVRCWPFDFLVLAHGVLLFF